VTSEIPVPAAAGNDEPASELTKRPPGARPTGFPGDLTALLAGYAAELAGTTLSAETRRTYISRVRQYRAWLAATHRRRRPGDQDPLASPRARDFAVRDYRRWLLHERPIKRSVVYANSVLTAIDDFYLRRGLGAPQIDRDDLPRQAPARWRRRPASAGCARSGRSPHPATGASPSSPATPAPASAKSFAWTSATCAAQPAKASCASTARATRSARSLSTPDSGRSLSSG